LREANFTLRASFIERIRLYEHGDWDDEALYLDGSSKV